MAFAIHWVHKRCSGLKGRLSDIPNFQCNKCLKLPKRNDTHKMSICKPLAQLCWTGTSYKRDTTEECTEIKLGDKSLENVKKFCYLKDPVKIVGMQLIVLKLE